MSKEMLGNCPACSAPVIETQEAYECSCCKCQFAIRKEALDRLGKKTIYAAEAKKLISGEKLKVKGLKGSNGKIFETEWKVQQQGK